MNVVPLSPIGQLKILKDVPLDNTYTDTLDFSSASAQYTFFSGKAKYSYMNMSPNRLTNQIKVPTNYDNLYDCNYIMFQNTNFGNKWFYAFINSIEYINPNNTMLTYQIDVFQTWQFDFTLNECLVERMHTPDDTPFKYLAPEPITPEEYIYNTNMHWNGSLTTQLGDMVYITALISIDKELPSGLTPQTVRDNIYNACYYYSQPVTNYAEVTTFLQGLVDDNKKESIIGVYMTPVDPNDIILNNYPVSTPFNRNTQTFGNYTVKNNKCLNYPFRKFSIISTDSGQRVEFRPELLNGENLTGRIYVSSSVPNDVAFVPFYATSENIENWDFSLNYSESPTCIWSTNEYGNWLNSQKISMPTKIIGNLMSVKNDVVGSIVGATSSATPSIQGVGAEVSYMNRSAGILDEFYQASRMPNTPSGSISGSFLNYKLKRYGFEGFCQELTENQIKRIDNFFTCKGYAINDVVQPNLKSRSSFNYIKTVSANVTGSIPFDDMNTIKSAFNRGITFWHGDYVGDYSRTNNPV